MQSVMDGCLAGGSLAAVVMSHMSPSCSVTRAERLPRCFVDDESELLPDVFANVTTSFLPFADSCAFLFPSASLPRQPALEPQVFPRQDW